MASQRREVAIVGAYEYPLRVAPGVSDIQIQVESIKGALDDAGLSWQDVDALYDPAHGAGGGGLGMSAYLGISPAVIDTTQVGGSSSEFMVAHAARDIAAGKASVAIVSHGQTPASERRNTGTRGATGLGSPNWQGNMEDPYGWTTIGNYAMVARRHMHEHGTTTAQLAEISVATRYHASRNPEAVQAMTDLQFVGVGEITVDDVLESRVIADPLHLLECCMISDGGGALVIASADVARGTKKPAVWVIGTGEATKYRTNGGDITTSAGVQSGPIAFGEAQVTAGEIDIAMIYDSFTITVAVCLEDLGFCAKGEIGGFVEGGRLRFDNPLKPALNTDGGGLSSNHPAGRGIFLQIESVRQLRGESTSQVEDARLAVAHGNGGSLGGSHSGGTVIFARD